MNRARNIDLACFIRREPLLRFLGIAALLFLVDAVLAGKRPELISVNQATIDYLVAQEEDLRVSARHPAQVPTYEAGSKWLEMEWIAEQQNALMDRALDEMRLNYGVELTGTADE